MPKLAVLAKTLGPKGLMPSPKAGTAVADVAKAAEELRGGKVEYKMDKFNIVHLSIGRVSFGAEKIAQNYNALIGALPLKKIETIYLTTSMGPSVRVAKK
jgi:large subunit ribosomal protein L1